METKDRTEPTTSVSAKTTYTDLLCLIAAVFPPAVLNLLLTSDFTSLGPSIYAALGGLHVNGIEQLFPVIGVGLLLFAYLFDLSVYKAEPWNYFAYVVFSLVGVCGLVTVLSWTFWAPTIPILLGVALTFFAVILMRVRLLSGMNVEDFSFLVYEVFMGLSAITFLWWGAWALANPPRTVEFVVGAPHSLATYIVWASPSIQSALYSIIALLAVLRSHVHLPDDPDAELDDRAAKFVQAELRLAFLSIIIVVLAMWIAASLVQEDVVGLAGSIQRVAAVVFFSSLVYIFVALGKQRVMKAAEASAAVRYSIEICKSEWIVALGFLVCLPFIPCYFALEFVHQLVRSIVHGDACGFLTVEAHSVWQQLVSFNVTSIITKSIYLGINIFIFSVLFGQGIYVFLVWLNECIASWSLISITCVLFGVGLFLFLLPPVPGVPIYLLAGALIVEKCSQNGFGFYWACILAVAFSFFVKLAAVVMQQKGIGEPLSTNVSVKQVIGIHTAPMKAVRHILGQKGLRPAKVAVLIGGPDWPTSVLTGIMGLSVFEMLLGSTPVLFVVAPFALTAAFGTHSQKLTTPAEADFYAYLSKVMFGVSSASLLSAMAVAGYYIQETLESNIEKIEKEGWEKDPQEDLVLERERIALAETEAFNRKTAWSLLPIWLRAVLLFGAVAASVLTLVGFAPLDPPQKPFMKFTLSNSLSDLPNGSVLGLVRPLGWVCIGIFCLCSSIAVVFHVWCSFCLSAHTSTPLDGEPTENTPLIQPAGSET